MGVLESMGSWGPVLVTAVINLGLGVFVYGKLTERVSNQGSRIDDVEEKQERHSELLYRHGERISHLEGKRHA